MNNKSLRILIMVILSLSLVSPASGAVLAQISSFIPWNHQSASLVLGQPDFTHSASASSQSGMKGPGGVSVDPTTGKVFVADSVNSRVLRFASVQTLTNGAAAEAVLGQANFSDHQTNRGGSVASDTMAYPYGLFTDSSGRLWVADTWNNRVLRFDNAASEANGANADGVLGHPDFTSSVYTTTQSGMYYPYGVFLDSGGRLWVADANNSRVLRFDNAASKANGANADVVLGQPNFSTRTRRNTQNGMGNPTTLVLDSGGRLWVGDYIDARVLRFDDAAAKTNGANADGVLGQRDFISSDEGCSQSLLGLVFGVTIDPDGRLYVADFSNHRVLVFENAAGLSNGANAGHVLGQPDFTTCTANTGGVSANSLYAPMGVFFDSGASVLWVADISNNRVLMYGKPFQIANLVLGQPDFTSSSASATQNRMWNPIGVAVDPTTGKVFVAEHANNRVLRFASVSALSNGAAAEAVLGQADFTHSQANRGGSVAANSMNSPNGICLDAQGRLYVADSWNNRVLRFEHAAAKSNGANADGVLGQADFTSNSSATNRSGMYFPVNVFLDVNGRLWVADFQNNRLLRFDFPVLGNGANAGVVLGQTDFISNGAATSQNGMHGPTGLFVDTDGWLWVTDYYNNRVLRFNNVDAKPIGGYADGVLGQTDFSSASSACSQGGLSGSQGVGGDLAGQLYMADTNNNRVLIFENAANLADGANASIVLGQPDFTTCSANTGGVSSVSLNSPTGAFFDNAVSVLWVADWSNNRVLMYGVPQFMVFAPLVRK